MTLSTAMAASSCCIKMPILIWPQGTGQTECHVIFKSLNNKPLGEGIKYQLYCTQDPEFKWLSITCMLLTDDCGGHSVFPSHFVFNAADIQCQRVKPSPKSCIFMWRICMKLWNREFGSYPRNSLQMWYFALCINGAAVLMPALIFINAAIPSSPVSILKWCLLYMFHTC